MLKILEHNPELYLLLVLVILIGYTLGSPILYMLWVKLRLKFKKPAVEYTTLDMTHLPQRYVPPWVSGGGVGNNFGPLLPVLCDRCGNVVGEVTESVYSHTSVRVTHDVCP